MNTTSLFKANRAGCAGFCSVLFVAVTTGSLFGQNPLVLENLEFVCPSAEACTITFEADSNLQIVTYATSDLECWVFAGGCNEYSSGEYQFVDLGVIELPKQFYRFGVFDPEVELPPQFEQLRAQLGEEQFAQWLQQNFAQFGTLQGLTPGQVEQLSEAEQEQFEEMEDVLNFWLKDFLNEAAPIAPELELPIEFDEIRVNWGDYDFAQFLVVNMDQWGNLQGVCEPLVIEWELNQPQVFLEFQTGEQVLGQWLNDYLVELPPIVLENFEEGEQVLPPQLEQLRQELGDEAFAQWLRYNLQQTGNHQGISEGGVPAEGSEAREEYESVEAVLEKWLREFEAE